MKYFNNCKTLEEAKKLWKQLAMQMHPDKGGNHDEFIEMNAEYYAFKQNFENPETNEPKFNIEEFEEFLQKNFGIGLAAGMEMILNLIMTRIKKKTPTIAFLFEAFTEGGVSMLKKKIDSLKTNNSAAHESKNNNHEVDEDELKFN